MRYWYLIAMGSNLGLRTETLHHGIKLLNERCGVVTAVAPFYETVPIGAADKPFINSALLLQTDCAPGELLRLALSIEAELGRTREVHWGNRTLDLDILLATDNERSLIQQEKGLTIPHPRLLERDFALVPAADIAPDWVHPASGLTLAEECRRRGYQPLPKSMIRLEPEH